MEINISEMEGNLLNKTFPSILVILWEIPTHLKWVDLLLEEEDRPHEPLKMQTL